MTDAPDDDAALVARCRLGDGQAWALLVRRHQRLVHAVARRIGLDEHAAADVFQTVFSRLLQHLHGLSEPQRLRAWIVTTTKREALRQRERARREVSMTQDEGDDGVAAEWDVADPAAAPDDALAELQTLAAVREALDRLDERCRMLIGLLYAADDAVAYEEVALRLGIAVGSVGPTRGRCLDKLRKLLG